uniref:TMEM62 Ig-like domain-containing protein n=2 Tax=Tetranychus urticae TaxID=32264 RepID=T1K694_TETUR
MTIFFAHYPTSSIIEESPYLRNIITGPYLCGHFHTLGGLKKMYATQSTGYLEIEVADWKDERMFRVASVDHGLFNFVDVKLEQWPIILVTNPKAAIAQMPRYEPLHRISNSTHIRVLAFSPSPIDSVSVRVDNEPWSIMNRAPKTHPLFTYPWNPEKYSAGLHKIEVLASDENGNENTETVEFSIDGTKPEYPFGARFILRFSTRSVLQCLFTFIIFIAIFPVIAMRLLFLIEKGPLIQSRARSSLIYRIYFKFLIFAVYDNFFIAMMILTLYTMIGPWFIGDLLEFGWGMYINGHWIPIGLPYLFASINMILFHIPLLSCLAHILHKRFLEVTSTSKSIDSSWPYLKPRHIIFVLLLICNVLFNFSICMAHGFKSLLFVFERFWSIVIYLYVWWTTFSLTSSDFKIFIKITRDRSAVIERKEQ